MQSRKNEIRALGRIWHTDGETVSTTVDGRFEVLTWEFGDIHQSKVNITDPSNKSPSEEWRVGVCLPYGTTRKEAMEIGLSWVKDYQSKGPKNPKTPETLFRECYKRYPELYPTRMRVIDHVFFVIGNGYDWVDGEIICTSLDDYGTWGKRNRVNEGWEKRHQEDVKEMKKYLTLRLKMAQESGKPLSPYEKNRLKELEERDLPRPLPDPVGPVRFYPACEYSKIACVPDNVRPEWLSLAYEVAKILRDRSGVPENYEGDAEAEKITQERNREFGGKIVTDLESRFPQLIQQA